MVELQLTMLDKLLAYVFRNFLIVENYAIVGMLTDMECFKFLDLVNQWYLKQGNVMKTYIFLGRCMAICFECYD